MQIKSHHSKKVDENSLKIQNAFPSSRLLPIIPYFTFIHHDHITEVTSYTPCLPILHIFQIIIKPLPYFITLVHTFSIDLFIKQFTIQYHPKFFFFKNSNKHFIVILTHPKSYIFSIPPKKNTFPPSPPPPPPPKHTYLQSIPKDILHQHHNKYYSHRYPPFHLSISTLLSFLPNSKYHLSNSSIILIIPSNNPSIPIR